jgi:hypothetical protein
LSGCFERLHRYCAIHLGLWFFFRSFYLNWRHFRINLRV